MSKNVKKCDILDSFKSYYQGKGFLSEDALKLIDKTVASLATMSERSNPGFVAYFGFQELDDFILDFGERFWNEKLLKGGFKLVCGQEDDDAVRATLRFLAEQFNNTVYITEDVDKAKSILDQICGVLSDAGMIHIANPEFRRNRVISRTGNFDHYRAEELFSKRFNNKSNNTSSLSAVLLELGSVPEVRYYDLIGKITPYYAHLKTVTMSPDSETVGEEESALFGSSSTRDDGNDKLEGGEFGAAKFSPGAENLLISLSHMIDEGPVQINRVFCPFRTKQILKDVIRDSGFELDAVAVETLRRLEINEINAFMLTLILKGERQGPTGIEAVTRICELLGIRSTRYYENVNRFQAVMAGLKDDRQYASEDDELVEIVKMFYNVYRRNCLYEPAA